MSQALEGRAHAPLTVGRGKRAPLTKCAPNARFLYQYHAERWMVLDGEVLPMLRKFHVRPGLGGVDKSGSFRRALAEGEGHGWTLIPEDVDGPGETYVRSVDGEKGTVWLDQFEIAYPGTDHVGTNRPGFVAWLLELLDRGVVVAPAVYVLEALALRTETQAAEAFRKSANDPQMKARADMLAANAAVVRARLAGALGTLEPVKVRKPRKLSRKPKPEAAGNE